MRIAFICKRRYTGKDVIEDRFGRLYQLPWHLAARGHAVRAWCLDYRANHGVSEWDHSGRIGSLWWKSAAGKQVNVIGYPWRLRKEVADFGPDLLMAGSDIPHAALGSWLADRLGVGYVLDLYDNFESYGQARIPGMRGLLKHAVGRADLVVAVSDQLRAKVEADYAPVNAIHVMPNAVDRQIFAPGDREAARRILKLPQGACLIGTAGGLSAMKGVGLIYEAWPRIAEECPSAHLVLAGPIEPSLPIPDGPRVHYLGELPSSSVAELFRALDVGIVTVADSAFGRFCFPQKIFEMLACNLPIVAADVGSAASLLAEHPGMLFTAGSVDGLCRAIAHQLQRPSRPTVAIPEWGELVAQLEERLVQLLEPRAMHG